MKNAKQLIVPLMGYPGLQLTRTSVKQNLTDAQAQFDSLAALAEKFNPDCVLLLMDLTIEAEALGAELIFPDRSPPSVSAGCIFSNQDIEKSRLPDPERDGRMPVFVETLRLLKRHLSIPRAAYIAGPFTLAAHLAGIETVVKAIRKDVPFLERLLDFTTAVGQRYARCLVENGADLIVILEPSATGDILSPQRYADFSQPYLERIRRAAKALTVLHICGNTTAMIPKMLTTDMDGISVDTVVDIVAVLRQAKLAGTDMAVMGNIDPVKEMILSDPASIQRHVVDLKTRAAPYVQPLSARWHSLVPTHGAPGGLTNFIISTGCDLPAETPLVNIAAFMQADRTDRVL